MVNNSEKEIVFCKLSDAEKQIEEKVINAIESQNRVIAEDIKKKLAEVDEEGRLKIAFVGQHNAGKSSIVSALTNNKGIKISTNVETDVTSQYEWGSVLLSDTPGLYAGVKEEHDASALEAIGKSDIIIFCITSSLFDDILINNFIDLAYKKAYKNKMVLVVNKMSQEQGEFNILKENYTKTIAKNLGDRGGNIDDFPIAFIDAKDYIEGLDDDDELMEISNFESLIHLLNEMIDSKGLLAKIGTKCGILSDAICEFLAAISTELDKNKLLLLNRLTKRIKKTNRDVNSQIDNINIKLKSSIMDATSIITEKIGEEDVSDKDYEIVNEKMKRYAEGAISDIEKVIENEVKDMLEDMDSILSSDIGQYVFTQINNDGVNGDKISNKNYSKLFDMYSSFSNSLKRGGETLFKSALKEGAKDLSKVSSSAGSTLHKIIESLGKVFGKKFKPWEAAKIAQEIGKVAKYVGPVLSVVDVVATIADKTISEQNNKKILEAKKMIQNQYSSIALDIVKEINCQYKVMEDEIFNSKLKEIDDIKNAMIEENEKNNEISSLLAGYQTEIKDIMIHI